MEEAPGGLFWHEGRRPKPWRDVDMGRRDGSVGNSSGAAGRADLVHGLSVSSIS